MLRPQSIDMAVQDNTQNMMIQADAKVSPVKKWLNSLIGRKTPVSKASILPDQAPKEEDLLGQTKVDITKPEDSIKNDFQAFSLTMNKFLGQVKKVLGPVVSKGGEESREAAQTIGKVVDASLVRKLVKIFLVVLFLISLFFIISRFINLVTENGGVVGEVSPTPTVFIYIPPKLSVYANDTVVLKLEEDLGVLSREVSNSIIRETMLNTPQLDFNISF